MLKSSGGGVDFLLLFLALRVGRKRLLKSDISGLYVFLTDFGLVGNEGMAKTPLRA